MKRLGSSDSLGALMSICPTTDEQSPRNSTPVYRREFQSMLDGLDEEGCIEESYQLGEKKRRLSIDQVKALEKHFEVENKLDPERKVKLAKELGLQPRQIAVWFQNRRARWKTKQLERDYGILKANYDSLKQSYEALQHENESLLNQIKESKEKLNEEKTESDVSIKEEITFPDTKTETKTLEQIKEGSPPLPPVATATDPTDIQIDTIYTGVNSVFPDHLKDGSSDSDSSAILNEDNSLNAAAISSSGGFLQEQDEDQNHFLFTSSPSTAEAPDSMPMSSFQFTSSSRNYPVPTQFVKMEEHNFITGEEACNFFSDEQAPTLQWYWS